MQPVSEAVGRILPVKAVVTRSLDDRKVIIIWDTGLIQRSIRPENEGCVRPIRDAEDALLYLRKCPGDYLFVVLQDAL